MLKSIKVYQKHSTNIGKIKIGPYNPLDGTGMVPYKNNIPNAAHVCVKAPTAGGKTFIAVNALHTIFSAYDSAKPKAVIWLVPWNNLLQQAVNTLSNPEHPYRQRLNSPSRNLPNLSKDTILF
ncbi:MAG: DEAD/DEAH box helicase family protein [Balneolales bacterium]|nr:DEAD/DEAH box helicase family protein [Balneolales bacterium]